MLGLPDVDIRVMRRLLSDTDIGWLRDQGVERRMVAKIRRERRALFSQWLAVLRTESRSLLKRQRELALMGHEDFELVLKNHIAISKDLLALNLCVAAHAMRVSSVHGLTLRWLQDMEQRLALATPLD
ncbi:MAG TPA: hypothetical protein VKU01_35040 [Bryobacteraceae bacterium]|nr:hypothetical protein [Bryobacteraceae bacterium]